MPLNDAELVQRTLDGDRDAFGDLVERHRRAVFALAIQRGFQPSDAEDVAQEVFLKAFRSLDSLKEKGSFESWLFGITSHVSADWARRRHRRRIEESGLEGHDEFLAPREDRVVMGLDQEREQVFSALREIPEDQQVVMTLRYLYGLSPKEIAQRLGEPRGTIRSRLHHALVFLKKAFAPDGRNATHRKSQSSQAAGGK